MKKERVADLIKEAVRHWAFQPELEMTEGEEPYVLLIESVADDCCHLLLLDKRGDSRYKGAVYHPTAWKAAIEAANNAVRLGAFKVYIRFVDIEMPEEED